MKKLMMTLALVAALASCSKDGDANCYWTDNGGNDWDHYPTPAEMEQLKQDCSCTPTFTEHCE